MPVHSTAVRCEEERALLHQRHHPLVILCHQHHGSDPRRAGEGVQVSTGGAGAPEGVQGYQGSFREFLLP